MEFIVGMALALLVCGAASWLGMDRDRVFYPLILIVIASYYVLFAVIDGSDKALLSEIAISAVFTGITVVGFKRNLWLVAGALAGHGVLDFFHHALVHNTGVPRVWPGFCLAFDLTAAVFVGCVLALRANGTVQRIDFGDQRKPHRGRNIMETSAQHDAAASSTRAVPSREARPARQTMRAIVQDEYGSLDVLRLRDIDKPVAKDHEVLIRVHAAGLHVGDCFSVRGAPFAMRLVTGLLRPKYGVPGFDVAGHVEAVGEHVTQFKPGDEVFGASNGTCAEYVLAQQSKLAPKPANLTFVQAAALPTSALAALHALRDVRKVQPGQSVLINGASGGVGTFAVQIAKSFGAQVTGVCSTTNVDTVRSIGADHVIDYTRDDFTEGRPQYDLIFDNVENRSLSDCRRALAPRGTLILNSGTGAHGIALLLRLVKPLVLSPFVRQSLRRYLSVPNHDDLVLLKELVESGKLTPVIDRTYPLRETPAALGHVEGGHARGKVVVTV